MGALVLLAWSARCFVLLFLLYGSLCLAISVIRFVCLCALSLLNYTSFDPQENPVSGILSVLLDA